MRDLAVWWDGEQWTVNVPFTLSPAQMQAIRERVLEVNVKRLVGLRAGDARDDLTRAVDALRAGKVRQSVIPNRDGVYNVFKSHERETTRFTSVGGQ